MLKLNLTKGALRSVAANKIGGPDPILNNTGTKTAVVETAVDLANFRNPADIVIAFDNFLYQVMQKPTLYDLPSAGSGCPISLARLDGRQQFLARQIRGPIVECAQVGGAVIIHMIVAAGNPADDIVSLPVCREIQRF